MQLSSICSSSWQWQVTEIHPRVLTSVICTRIGQTGWRLLLSVAGFRPATHLQKKKKQQIITFAALGEFCSKDNLMITLALKEAGEHLLNLKGCKHVGVSASACCRNSRTDTEDCMEPKLNRFEIWDNQLVLCTNIAFVCLAGIYGHESFVKLQESICC